MPEGSPRFISEFSKENDAAGRSETARLILDKRAEGRQRLEDERQIAERVEELKRKLEEIDTDWIAKVFHRGEIAQTKNELVGLETSEREREVGKDEKAEANQILLDYYEKQKQLWRKSGYEAADVEKYFTEENLEKLNIQDYALLLSRFPSEMATHVTRQGLRDHVGMREHTAGLGEYADNFIDILKSGRLHSVVGRFLSEEKKEEALADYFKWLVGQFRVHAPWIEVGDEELISSLIEKWGEASGEVQDGKRINSSMGGIGGFGDRAALHMAKDAVLSSFYGGENDNEIFFAYPAAHIFSDHQFAGGMGGNDNGNDVFVWTKENQGLSVDASLVFLPKSTMVDVNTGSRYLLNDKMEPTVNEDSIDTILKCIASDEFIEMMHQLYKGSTNYYYNDGRLVAPVESFLQAEFGTIDPKVVAAIVNSAASYKLKTFINYELAVLSNEEIGRFAAEMLSDVSLYYAESDNTVRAEEYWETYFSNNPELRPSKTVYYDGSPTRALESWLHENGAKNYNKRSLRATFDATSSPAEQDQKRMDAIYSRYDEFMAICEKALEKAYPNSY